VLDREPDAELQFRELGVERDGIGPRNQRDLGIELCGLLEHRVS
jgi:hypothetical protein